MSFFSSYITSEYLFAFDVTLLMDVRGKLSHVLLNGNYMFLFVDTKAT